jgi:protein-L-isoaspartate(D-aspartate) O-methyltransferase
VSLAARKIRLIMALRRSGVTDTAVLAAIERIPREAFVPEAFHDQSYEDKTLPIGQGLIISQPQIVALMTQALDVTTRHKVLEVGTGSGYQTAVLSRLARRVYTIERHWQLLKEAEQRFAGLRIHNVTAIAGDGMKGWPAQAPFDRIIVTAAAAELPQTLLGQLAVGGIMVLPIGAERSDQELIRLRNTEQGVETEKLCDVRFVPLLPGLPQERARQ